MDIPSALFNTLGMILASNIEEQRNDVFYKVHRIEVQTMRERMFP